MISLIPPAKFGAALLVLLIPMSVRAANYYVATTGSDSAAGTEAAPFATVGRGQMAAAAGDTVFIRGGVYMIASTTATVGVAFSKSGTAGSLIKYFAYPGETPIFDLFGVLPQARVTGFDVHCNYVHIRGIEVRGTQQIITGDSWGVRIQGNNNIIENMNVHHGEAPGFFITSGSNNLILNCDSHDNYDPLEGGGNGDGFGCHSSGGGNIIRGCRGYRNSDDGYDFINAAGTCTVEQSWAWGNGYQYTNGSPVSAGNGAGFKAGGYGSPPSTSNGATHTVRQCVAFGNKAQGFYANHHPGRINFHNNTAFNNPANFNMLADSGYPSDHVIRNNVAMTTGSTISNLTGGTATFNSWNLSVTANASDFGSLAETAASAARQADGSLPTGFARLVAGSDLIDKGTDVALPFVGSAPDLGAFEFGATTPGTGGAMGTGGATGTGGAPGTGGAGGRAGTGGAGGAGGRAATGGGSGTGGTAGGAGRAGTGGTTAGTGGSTTAGTGGSTTAGTGGSTTVGTGGSTTAGTGGSTTAGTGGAGTGGVTGAGTGGAIGTGGAAGGPGMSDVDAGACACRATGGGGLGDVAGLAAFALFAAVARRGRRKSAGGSAQL